MPPPTDKHTSGLAAVYAELFKGWRKRPVRVLEIGMDQGGSLWLWAKIFRHRDSLFVGVDLEIPQAALPKNARAHACDQNDSAGLERLAKQYGPFDLIIDDGSHFARETRTCFQTLFGGVKTGGCYVIEDWAVGYWKDREPGYCGMVEMVTEIMQNAPALSVAAFTVLLKPGQSFAAFYKGAQGWEI